MNRNLLAAVRALAGRYAKAHGDTLTYRRGNTTTTVQAWPGALDDVAARPRGTTSQLTRRESWLIPAASLAFDDVVSEPAEGDELDQTLADGTVLTWRVKQRGDLPAWRYADRTRVLLRVFVVLVAKEE